MDSAAGGSDDLARWAAELRADDAAATRSRAWWLRRQAEEEATLTGLLVDLAETGAEVLVQTATGRSHRGRIGAVAEGFCSLEARGTTVVVATAALTVVRVPGGAVAPAAERAAPLALTFAEALARLAADRPRVLVATAGDPGGVRGELVAVGRDVLTLRADGDGASIHVRLGAVLEVVLV